MQHTSNPQDETSTTNTMSAITHREYGPPDVLTFSEVERPTIGDDRVMVRVHASSVNALEWHMMTGTPYLVRLQAGLRRPKLPSLGTDAAGTVVAVGKDVSQFSVGDEILGGVVGAYAEYAIAREGSLAKKPTGVSFEQAAAVPVAGLTALQGLRDVGKLSEGDRVLINGASGGVGTFAIQIANALGAGVTAVCSTQNVESARALGADHVVDYTEDDFTQGDERYDLVLDIVGTGPIRGCKRVLKPEGRYVIIGGPKGRWMGPLARILRTKLAFMGSKKTASWFIAETNTADLEVLADLMDSGQVESLIEATYPLSDTATALHRFGAGHAKGKTVISIL